MASITTEKNWYQISVLAKDNYTMLGQRLGSDGSGAVWFSPTDETSEEQQWQIYLYNTTYYVFRTAGCGPSGYMMLINNTGGTHGAPCMKDISFADDSMYWGITPMGDGTFYLTNAAVGDKWHLAIDDGSTNIGLDSNLTYPRPGQSFSFSPLGEINNASFSSIATPPVTSTGTTLPSTTSHTTRSPTTSASMTSPPTPAHKSGLPTGASAGIGASIGGVALIAVLVLGFWFMRRRKRRIESPPAYPEDEPSKTDTHKTTTQELDPTERRMRYELDIPPVEIAVEQRAELMGGDVRH
ncbi:uncharacterized protein PAC_02198 [Phialocephala subalpina]|uniref:Ricin B lectin domain-containing protein n=1 Tax=Phialocephala subalpina TaxID=576137 RepID=A0A1L7WHS2_9HELO|nr:uncharacterized protein PAC_02198 [Phialocephala subalpina]